MLNGKKLKIMKPTKRKAFNFLRSYFDVFNELQNDKDKIDFLSAILNKQFLDEDPKGLNFIVNLCYESQRHAIESSVKGWIRVNKTDMLGNPLTNPMTNPPTNPTTNPQEEEEKEEVKEEDIINNIYNKFVDEVKAGNHAQATEEMYMRLKIKKGSLTPLLKEFKGQLIIDQTVHKTTLQLRKHFNNWLNTQERVGKLAQYKLKT